MINYIVKGTTQDVTSCDCCGKVGLKATVIMSVADGAGNATSEIKHFGRVCAARHAGRSAKAIAAEAKAADKVVADAAALAKAKADREANAAWFGWLNSKVTKPSVFEQIQALGGYRTAHELFEKETGTCA